MISGILIIVLMTGFLCITWWAYSSRNKERFADAAQLPLEEDAKRSNCTDGGECCGGCNSENQR
ncbi:cbb3-type cytochrome c oxidase subunit 3 [Sinimarinibacterium sp. CAU 1509]|uniref:cbb3-type cytochrome oxidase subunit 3 n=1 Tax=Sinimarinibacterium sp. CAU 1509 TaxID=2562283 RepID=UPI0010ABD866|nr:cbb3-type cytochrome c oxidase subunit 3 [Sinimarinibacterium sp. CAU 1509]TJY63008.1 cbb3-type cytochrome c oxidase subunit 3 [Sinimarinibacterium sp. CAU 1509]